LKWIKIPTLDEFGNLLELARLVVSTWTTCCSFLHDEHRPVIKQTQYFYISNSLNVS